MGLLPFEFRVLILNLYSVYKIIAISKLYFHAFALANIKASAISSMFLAILCLIDRVGLQREKFHLRVLRFLGFPMNFGVFVCIFRLLQEGAVHK